MKDMVAPVCLGAGESPEKCAFNHFLKQEAAIKILYENIKMKSNKMKACHAGILRTFTDFTALWNEHAAGCFFSSI